MDDSVRDTWETYAAAWKEASAEAKLAKLRTSTDSACIYRDPLVRTDGHEALVRYMLDFHRQVPGGWFETTCFRAHHGRSVARWNMRGADGTVLGEGVSFGEYGEHGRLLTMTGFFDPPEG